MLDGDNFLDRDKVVERTITVRFFTRAPGPLGLQNPEWLLMVRAVKLTLVGVQPRQLAGKLPAAGRRLPFLGQGTMPEDRGVHGRSERRHATAVDVAGGARSVSAGPGGGIGHLRNGGGGHESVGANGNEDDTTKGNCTSNFPPVLADGILIHVTWRLPSSETAGSAATATRCNRGRGVVCASRVGDVVCASGLWAGRGE